MHTHSYIHAHIHAYTCTHNHAYTCTHTHPYKHSSFRNDSQLICAHLDLLYSKSHNGKITTAFSSGVVVCIQLRLHIVEPNIPAQPK